MLIQCVAARRTRATVFFFCIDETGDTIFDIGRFVLSKSTWKKRSHEVMSTSKLADGSEHIYRYSVYIHK